MTERHAVIEKRVADAICGALASWMEAPLHSMAYDDAARAAMAAVTKGDDNNYCPRCEGIGDDPVDTKVGGNCRLCGGNGWNPTAASIEATTPVAHGTEAIGPQTVMPKDSPCATSAAAQSWPSEEDIARVLWETEYDADQYKWADAENIEKHSYRVMARAVLARCADHSLMKGPK